MSLEEAFVMLMVSVAFSSLITVGFTCILNARIAFVQRQSSRWTKQLHTSMATFISNVLSRQRRMEKLHNSICNNVHTNTDVTRMALCTLKELHGIYTHVQLIRNNMCAIRRNVRCKAGEVARQCNEAFNMAEDAWEASRVVREAQDEIREMVDELTTHTPVDDGDEDSMPPLVSCTSSEDEDDEQEQEKTSIPLSPEPSATPSPPPAPNNTPEETTATASAAAKLPFPPLPNDAYLFSKEPARIVVRGTGHNDTPIPTRHNQATQAHGGHSHNKIPRWTSHADGVVASTTWH